MEEGNRFVCTRCLQPFSPEFAEAMLSGERSVKCGVHKAECLDLNREDHRKRYHELKREMWVLRQMGVNE